MKTANEKRLENARPFITATGTEEIDPIADTGLGLEIVHVHNALDEGRGGCPGRFAAEKNLTGIRPPQAAQDFKEAVETGAVQQEIDLASGDLQVQGVEARLALRETQVAHGDHGRRTWRCRLKKASRRRAAQ